MEHLVSLILPCRNEEKTIGRCIDQIRVCLEKNRIDGEIIVSDSSSDNSAAIAKKKRAIVVSHNLKGYGIAIIKGAERAKGKYLIIGDPDGTYDFSQIPLLLNKAKEFDLVIGSRIKGEIMKGAMPWHHRYIGTPILSWILNLFFKTNVSDSHSGFRLIKKQTFRKLGLRSTGMEFASEMIIKAAKNRMKIAEVPIGYYPRQGTSKLRSFSDGWRHLRFMLMFSPTYLFFLPGMISFLSGVILTIAGRNYVGPMFTVLGFQIISLGLYSKVYSFHSGFDRNDTLIDFIAEHIPLERGIVLSLGILAFALLMFSSYPYLALTMTIIGLQSVFSIFFLSMMVVEKR